MSQFWLAQKLRLEGPHFKNWLGVFSKAERRQVLQDLDHPNIVRLFEYGEDGIHQKIHCLMAPWPTDAPKTRRTLPRSMGTWPSRKLVQIPYHKCPVFVVQPRETDCHFGCFSFSRPPKQVQGSEPPAGITDVPVHILTAPFCVVFLLNTLCV